MLPHLPHAAILTSQQGQAVHDDLAQKLSTELEWTRLEAEVKRIRQQWATNLGGRRPPWGDSAGVHAGQYPGSGLGASNQPGAGAGPGGFLPKREYPTDDVHPAGSAHWDGGRAQQHPGTSPSPVPSSAGGLPRYRPASRAGSRGGLTTASAFFPRAKQQRAGAAAGQRQRGKGDAVMVSEAEELFYFVLEQLKLLWQAALRATRDAKARAELVERGAAFVSVNAHILCAVLGVLICLYLQRAGYLSPGMGRARASMMASQHNDAVAEGALAAVRAFATDARLALKDIVRGARDSVFSLALAPVSATRVALSAIRSLTHLGRSSGLSAAKLPTDPVARAAIQRARAQRSAAYAAARCGTADADVDACAALLDSPPESAHMLWDDALPVSDLDLDAAWKDAQCGTPRGDASTCAALESLRASGRASQGAVTKAVLPASGDVSAACSLALAASETRTQELVAVQAEVESRVKRLAVVRAQCASPGADAEQCSTRVSAAEAAAGEDTARLEALTVRAEAASQRAYTLCMAAQDRGSSAAAAAAGLVDWLASEADTLLAHTAALEEQRAAAAAKAAVEAALQGGEATPAGAVWANLAAQLEEDIEATRKMAATTRAEAKAAAKANSLPGRVYSSATAAAASLGRQMWLSSVTREQVTMAYAMAAMAAPLTALAVASAHTAEKLRGALASRRQSRAPDSGGGDGDAVAAAVSGVLALATASWVALSGEPKVGALLMVDITPPPELQAKLDAAELEALEYEFVWTRSFRGVFEVLEGQHAPWYTLTRDDLGSRLAVTVSSVLPDGEYGPTASARSRTVKA